MVVCRSCRNEPTPWVWTDVKCTVLLPLCGLECSKQQRNSLDSTEGEEQMENVCGDSKGKVQHCGAERPARLSLK